MFVVEKYDLVGRLLKPGEEPADYTDTEEEHIASDRRKEDWLIQTVKSVYCQWSIMPIMLFYEQEHVNVVVYALRSLQHFKKLTD